MSYTVMQSAIMHNIVACLLEYFTIIFFIHFWTAKQKLQFYWYFRASNPKSQKIWIKDEVDPG